MISKEGEVGFFDAGGSRMEEVKIGGLIPRTYTIVTGANSQMVGLLSNGTLITLVEKTRMRVQTFQQEPFDPQGKKLKDLKEEPSGSKVELELDMGSLIVSTKKLDRQSSFDINSPLGTAGIRGTEFQMALDPSQGVQLDVTESTVAFSPPGGGQPIAVSEGSGLSVTPTGTVTQRPVNPTAAQRISNTNQAATASSENISLNDVTTAMEQATTEAETMLEESPETMEDSSEEPKEEETQPEREEEAPMEEEAPSGDTDEPSSEPSEEPVPVEESSEPAAGEVDDAEPQSGDSEPQAEAETETTGSTSADGGEGVPRMTRLKLRAPPPHPLPKLRLPMPNPVAKLVPVPGKAARWIQHQKQKHLQPNPGVLVRLNRLQLPRLLPKQVWIRALCRMLLWRTILRFPWPEKPGKWISTPKPFRNLVCRKSRLYGFTNWVKMRSPICWWKKVKMLAGYLVSRILARKPPICFLLIPLEPGRKFSVWKMGQWLH